MYIEKYELQFRDYKIELAIKPSFLGVNIYCETKTDLEGKVLMHKTITEVDDFKVKQVYEQQKRMYNKQFNEYYLKK